MRTQSRPTRAVGPPLAELKSAIDEYLSLAELLHLLSVLTLCEACTADATEEEDSDDYGGLESEAGDTPLQTALLGYPVEVSQDVQYCLDILDRQNDSTLNFKVMGLLWVRVRQQLTQR